MDADKIIEVINNYSYYTDNELYLSAFDGLNNAKTTKQLQDGLKNLSDCKLLAVIFGDDKRVTKKLMLFIDNIPIQDEKLNTLINLKISPPLRDRGFFDLVAIDKTINEDYISNLLEPQTNFIKQNGVGKLSIPVAVRDADVLEHHGRLSPNNYIELVSAGGVLKESTFTHEVFHYIDAILAEKEEFKNNDERISTHISNFYGLDEDALKEHNSPLLKIKEHLPKFFDFVVNFDNSPRGQHDKNFSRKYIKEYLDLDMDDYKSPQEVYVALLAKRGEVLKRQTNQVLDVSQKTRIAIKKKLMNVDKDEFKNIAMKLYEYHHGSMKTSLYSSVSKALSLISNFADEERHHIHEKMARVFEMNAAQQDFTERKQPTNIEDRTAYPHGHEREHYLNALNSILKEEISHLLASTSELKMGRNSKVSFDKEGIKCKISTMRHHVFNDNKNIQLNNK